MYCIRLGYTLVIIGSGGFKSKTIRALQEDTILDAEQKIMVNLSAEILKRQREKDIWYTYNYMDLEGDLDFEF